MSAVRPRHPAAVGLPRVLVLVLVAGALAAGCNQADTVSCPGTVVGRFGLRATRVDAPATACTVPAGGTVPGEPSGGWVAQVPACLPAVTDPTTCGTQPPLVGTFTTDGNGNAAFCTGRRLADQLVGPLTDALVGSLAVQHVKVEATTDGAVVGACAATCAARLTVRVDGNLVPATDTAPASFQGTLVETLDAVDPAACGSCTLPCVSTFTLDGAAL